MDLKGIIRSLCNKCMVSFKKPLSVTSKLAHLTLEKKREIKLLAEGDAASTLWNWVWLYFYFFCICI